VYGICTTAQTGEFHTSDPSNMAASMAEII